MKRILLVTLVVVLTLVICTSVASAVDFLGTFATRIHCSIVQSGNTVRGSTMACLYDGESVSFTVKLQILSTSGTWITKKQVSGDGAKELIVSYPVSSGKTYRISYSYAFYASPSSTAQRGSGTSTELSIP